MKQIMVIQANFGASLLLFLSTDCNILYSN